MPIENLSTLIMGLIELNQKHVDGHIDDVAFADGIKEQADYLSYAASEVLNDIAPLEPDNID